MMGKLTTQGVSGGGQGMTAIVQPPEVEEAEIKAQSAAETPKQKPKAKPKRITAKATPKK
jgi:hypothetical protein